MLFRLRRLARPFSGLALLLLLAPTHLSASGPTRGHNDGSMPCCMMHEDGSSGVKADCCAVGGQEPDPSRPAGTTPGARTSDGKAPASAPVASPDAAIPAAHPARELRAVESPPPPHRLHLRLSVIRC
jgi:hypothetical protein